ncbi:MAG TPA: S-layer homology domain-containing protein [Candidatus Sulfotelmatobacter sp.]|nr:S-layer homology domain-containing protein [Candidatus Sulfotelmatobacter sp.]
MFLALGIALSALALPADAGATPFADVPANHWAYQAIQSLAADGLIDGYPDGTFDGERPLTRYEMAVLVARIVAKLQANGAGYASKTDLELVQKLIDALKDELDALGVRVTNLEDALDQLDRRTKLAQQLSLHGQLLQDNSYRQRPGVPTTLSGGAIDPFVNAFLAAPPNGSPLDQVNPGTVSGFDDRFNVVYTPDENLTVSLPIRIIGTGYGGEYVPQQGTTIDPTIEVHLAQMGPFSDVTLTDGEISDLRSSRLGLTYRAPDASQQGDGFDSPLQPYEHGYEIGGVLGGRTSFQFAYTRLDPTVIDTLPGILGNDFTLSNYFLLTDRPPVGAVQPGAPGSTSGALRTDTFTAAGAPLSAVYLTQKAQLGTVYVSAFDGTPCGANALTPDGAGCPLGGGAWYFVAQTNQVVFRTPLPVGSVVAITYDAIDVVNDVAYQRYHVNARLDQQLAGLPGGEIGLSFSRIFDAADGVTSPNDEVVLASSSGGLALVSDTVFGVDTQLPLAFVDLGSRTNHPLLFAEGALSKYTPDASTVAPVTDNAGVVGLRLSLAQATLSVQYQAVGPHYLDGAPLQYDGPVPPAFSYWQGAYFPQFFGFANTLTVNQHFDAAAGTHTAANPALTTIEPVFNPFIASGPQYFSAYAPNTQGLALTFTAPVRIGDVRLSTRLLAEDLASLAPDGFGPLAYEGTASADKLRFDHLEAGVQLALPIFRRSVAFDLGASTERLYRDDPTGVPYVPFNASLGTADPASAAALLSLVQAGLPPPLTFPNAIDEHHTTLTAGATVPISHDFSLGAAYDHQLFNGAYGSTFTNVDERKDDYTLSATYAIPRTTSSVSALYSNQRYTDQMLPSFNFEQNREDVNFTVRF